MRQYYEAYDDRYRQVHQEGLCWSSQQPSAIVKQMLEAYKICPDQRILELGCGEGRDASYLLRLGYNVLATDISPEAIRYCGEKYPELQGRFEVLDCLSGSLEAKFDFIYAVAVIHMLVEDQHRDGFYRFIRDHLNPNGKALICTMGDGTINRKSDTATAFDLQERTHQESGRTLLLAGTSCRMVDVETFRGELERNDLRILQLGLTSVEPDFPVMMYATVSRL